MADGKVTRCARSRPRAASRAAVVIFCDVFVMFLMSRAPLHIWRCRPPLCAAPPGVARRGRAPERVECKRRVDLFEMLMCLDTFPPQSIDSPMIHWALVSVSTHQHVAIENIRFPSRLCKAQQSPSSIAEPCRCIHIGH
eukprot:SAG11_NODE_2126_length_3781_cov_80.824823_5_plen_139_part_00